MDEITKIVVEEFEKKTDDAWVSIKTSDVTTRSGSVIRIPAGMIFKKGSTFLGFDLAELLDKVSGNKAN